LSKKGGGTVDQKSFKKTQKVTIKSRLIIFEESIRKKIWDADFKRSIKNKARTIYLKQNRKLEKIERQNATKRRKNDN